MALKSFVGSHVPDAEWLIALWFAIHGGDPEQTETLVGEAAAREAAIDIIAAVAPYAAGGKGARVDILKKLGITVTKHQTEVAPGTISPARCYSTGYGHYCINDPPPPPREF